MKRILNMLLLASTVTGIALNSVGCKTIARENIISSINTGIGISLTENPKTEMYEVKIGYIRSQFYSVPTGKTVEDDCTNGAHHTNHAHKTPEMVAGIRMESGIEQLLVGLKVTESFAVGKTAVMSPAAVAMYVANAESDAKAMAASSAAAAATKSLEKIRSVDAPEKVEKKMAIAQIRQQGPAAKAKVDAAIAKPANGGFADWNAFLAGDPTDAQLDSILNEVKQP
jgi:hypothetical protein